jgi:hypothetical protein
MTLCPLPASKCHGKAYKFPNSYAVAWDVGTIVLSPARGSCVYYLRHSRSVGGSVVAANIISMVACATKNEITVARYAVALNMAAYMSLSAL